MDFLNELFKRKEAYENDLIMAKAKVCVINELIAEIEAKTQPEEETEELAHIDESY